MDITDGETPRVVHDFRAYVRCVVGGIDGVGQIGVPVVIAPIWRSFRREDFEAHKGDVPADPNDAFGVVPHRPNNTRAVCPVIVVVDWVVVAVVEIPASEVVRKSIPVIVDPVSRKGACFLGVHPHVPGEIIVCVVDSGIDNGYQNVGTPRPSAPRLGSPDVGVRAAPGLPSVPQPP